MSGLIAKYRLTDELIQAEDLPKQFNHVPRVGETIVTANGDKLVVRWLDWSQDEYDTMIITL